MADFSPRYPVVVRTVERLVATGAPTLTVAAPGDAETGDMLFLVVGSDNLNAESAITADGWTRWLPWETTNHGTGYGWRIYYRTWNGASSSYGPYSYATGPDFLAWCVAVEIPNYARALDGNPFTGFVGTGVSANTPAITDTEPEITPDTFRLSPPYAGFQTAAHGLLLGGAHPADAVFTAVYARSFVGDPPDAPSVTPSAAEGTITSSTGLLFNADDTQYAYRRLDRVDVRNAIEDGGVPLLSYTIDPYDGENATLSVFTLTVQRTRGPFITDWSLDGEHQGPLTLEPAHSYEARLHWQADRYAPDGALGIVRVKWGPTADGSASEQSGNDSGQFSAAHVYNSRVGGSAVFIVADSLDKDDLPLYEDGITRLADHQSQSVAFTVPEPTGLPAESVLLAHDGQEYHIVDVLGGDPGVDGGGP
jgi:hypothetical protein